MSLPTNSDRPRTKQDASSPSHRPSISPGPATNPQQYPPLGPQPHFSPTTFKVFHEGRYSIILPIELINTAVVACSKMTANDLNFERFWDLLTSQSGHVAEGNQLMVEVPDDCGDVNMDLFRVKTGRDWRNALQLCHDAGWDKVKFTLLQEDAVETAAREEADRTDAARIEASLAKTAPIKSEASQKEVIQGLGRSLVGGSRAPTMSEMFYVILLVLVVWAVLKLVYNFTVGA